MRDPLPREADLAPFDWDVPPMCSAPRYRDVLALLSTRSHNLFGSGGKRKKVHENAQLLAEDCDTPGAPSIPFTARNLHAGDRRLHTAMRGPLPEAARASNTQTAQTLVPGSRQRGWSVRRGGLGLRGKTCSCAGMLFAS